MRKAQIVRHHPYMPWHSTPTVAHASVDGSTRHVEVFSWLCHHAPKVRPTAHFLRPFSAALCAHRTLNRCHVGRQRNDSLKPHEVNVLFFFILMLYWTHTFSNTCCSIRTYKKWGKCEERFIPRLYGPTRNYYGCCRYEALGSRAITWGKC